MMTESDSSNAPVSAQELANMRQAVNLLRSQIQAGRVDGTFLTRQIARLADLLSRLEADQRETRRADRFEALYNVSRLLGSSLDLQIVLNQVMDAIILLSGAERGFLMLRDDDGQLEVRTARNFDKQTLDDARFQVSRTIINQVMDSGQAVLTTNAAEDPRFAGQASIVGQGLRSIMATPLRARGRVIGVTYVDNRAVTGMFDEEDLTALDTFAGQAAIAIDNARLFSATDQELAARVEELTQLRRIDLQLNETLDAEKAMQYTLEWASRVAQATTGYMGMLDSTRSRIQTVHTYGVGIEETILFNLETPFPAALDVIATGRTVTVSTKRSTETALIIPLRHKQEVVGVVVLRREGAFTANQQDLAERVVAHGAVAIENARLYAAVQEADRAKSEFVGIVAHDLKVPMTSIMGYADLTLLEDNLNERQTQFQHKIRDTVRRMEKLVSDLADLSRIESGHFYMNETNVNVADVVQAVKDNMVTYLQSETRTYVEHIETNLPDVRADYYRLLQVLTNLMSNAFKYTPEGGTITLSIWRDDDCVRFSVADTGVGMSRQALSMLGTKFWRADDPYTRSQPGTGLGFAITQSLIQQMGGRIDVESTVGKGSTFTFCVPISPD